MSEQRRRFKDWFDDDAAAALTEQISAVYPSFPRESFLAHATTGLAALEMMGRVRQFSDALATSLPPPPASLRILADSLPPPLEGTEAVTDGYLQWPVGQYIADHTVEHFAAAMDAMVELTQRFSSEFAVRPFVERYPDATFARLLALTSHPSPHVRRWCSEGIRPRLPWGRRLSVLIEDPSPIWPVLEALKDDDVPYVRRSVANALNDIAKDHPEKVVARCRAWSRDAPAGRRWIVKHALRSLVKAGDPRALAVVGFGPPTDIAATLTIDCATVPIGGVVRLDIALHNRSETDQSLLVDYAVTFVRKSGAGTTPKVFKGTQLTLEAGARQTVTKRHPFRPATTRALYPGVHPIAIQVNGVVLARAAVTLTVS